MKVTTSSQKTRVCDPVKTFDDELNPKLSRTDSYPRLRGTPCVRYSARLGSIFFLLRKTIIDKIRAQRPPDRCVARCQRTAILMIRGAETDKGRLQIIKTLSARIYLNASSVLRPMVFLSTSRLRTDPRDRTAKRCEEQRTIYHYFRLTVIIIVIVRTRTENVFVLNPPGA